MVVHFKNFNLFFSWGRYIWIALALIILFWVTDSAVDGIFFDKSDFLTELWPDDSKELWMRLIVSAVIFLFGCYAQANSNRSSMIVQRQQLDARIFHSAGEAIMVTDANNHIVDVNEAFETITGYRRSAILGKSPRVLQSGRHDKTFYQQLWTELVNKGQWEGEIWDRRADGEIYPKWLTITVLKDSSGQVTNYIAVFRDISSLKETEDKLHHIAHHDALTGLDNRGQLQANLDKAIEHAKRYHKQLGVLFIDLDRFKDINDTLGHTIGDQVLQEAAQRLVDCVRSSDAVARLGGDEFVVVLDDLPNENVATDIAAKILDFFGQPFTLEKHELFVTPSIGISVYPEDGHSADELLKHADVAMYHAKDSGRNNYQFFSQQLNEVTAQRFKLLTALRYAIDNQGFELHYQPQVKFTTGEVCGVEALIRWGHDELGFIPPDMFIPLCEETGLIQEVDDWVLMTACKQYCSWQEQGCAPPCIAVNISAREIKQAHFIDRIERVLSTTGMDPRHLDLEITENLLIEEDPVVMQTLERLRKLGLTLVMDDFGTGYSSLSYLKRLPFDVLKVDRSFVGDIPDDQDDTAITAAIIAMAHSLRLRVIAEGVETDEQIEYLRSQQCDIGQGYKFCRPVSTEAITQFLKEQPVLQISA